MHVIRMPTPGLPYKAYSIYMIHLFNGTFGINENYIMLINSFKCEMRFTSAWIELSVVDVDDVG